MKRKKETYGVYDIFISTSFFSSPEDTEYLTSKHDIFISTSLLTIPSPMRPDRFCRRSKAVQSILYSYPGSWFKAGREASYCCRRAPEVNYPSRNCNDGILWVHCQLPSPPLGRSTCRFSQVRSPQYQFPRFWNGMTTHRTMKAHNTSLSTGVRLSEKWDTMDTPQRLECTRALTLMLKQMTEADLEFPAYGCLYYGDAPVMDN